MQNRLNGTRIIAVWTLLVRLLIAGDDPTAVVERPVADSRSARPASASFPEGPLGEVIRLGREIVQNTTTHPLSKEYTGNALNCTSCHLRNGTDLKVASFVGVASAYPAWAPREKRVITLEDRVLNCFMRSCNGTRPPLGSRVSVAITSYITWLSTDVPVRMNAMRPAGPHAAPKISLNEANADLRRGKDVYAARCAQCHGENGQGVNENPPVWGLASFNHGAGLANNLQLASWLKVAMPMDDATLTEREALDVAAFVNSDPRPLFQIENHLPTTGRLGEYNSEVIE